MFKYITHSPSHLFDCLLPSKAKPVLRDSPWRPSWKLAAILKNNLNIWIAFITSIAHFAWSKHTLCCHNNLFWPFTAIFKAKKWHFRIPHGSHLGKWRPYWNFAWSALFSWIVTPIEYLCQICCLYHNLNDSYSYLLRYKAIAGSRTSVALADCDFNHVTTTRAKESAI